MMSFFNVEFIHTINWKLFLTRRLLRNDNCFSVPKNLKMLLTELKLRDPFWKSLNSAVFEL